MNQKELNRIAALPDYLPYPEIEREITFLMRSHMQTAPDAAESRLILSALSSMADRVWNTYEPLPDAARRRLSTFVIGLWDRQSLESTQLLMSIIASLGLSDALASIAAIDPATLPPAITAHISSAVAEFGDTVHDPYSGIK